MRYVSNAGDPGVHRVFFALWPDAPAARALARFCATDPAAVLVQDLHLTLVFIGAVDAATFQRLPSVAQGLRCAPFDLCIDHTEYWPRPRVQVALPKVVPAALRELHDQLCRRLAAAGIGQARGIEPEFRPHVSLTRGSAPRAGPDGAPAPVQWHVAQVTLAVTEPVPGGAHYRCAASLPLSPEGT